MKWFKALSRLYRIPKVRRLKESDRWRYVACLSLAGERDSEDGELPDIADLAIHLGVTEKSLRTSCANIVEVGLFEWDGDDNHVRVLKWAEHQNTRKDTQKQYRERQKKAPLRNGDVTGEVKRPLEESRVDKIRVEEKREDKDIGAAPVEIQEEETEEITSNHPCIKAWQDVMHRFPPKGQWALIVRDSMGDRKTVARALQTWKAKSWNPTNYDAICERMRYIRAKDVDALVEQEKRMYEQQNEFGNLTGLT